MPDDTDGVTALLEEREKVDKKRLKASRESRKYKEAVGKLDSRIMDVLELTGREGVRHDGRAFRRQMEPSVKYDGGDKAERTEARREFVLWAIRNLNLDWCAKLLGAHYYAVKDAMGENAFPPPMAVQLSDDGEGHASGDVEGLELSWREKLNVRNAKYEDEKELEEV